MADWTTIPDSSIEPGKPIRSIDGLALRDNPIAITKGASGAPRIIGLAAQRLVDYPVLSVSAANTYRAQIGSNPLELATSTNSTSEVVAYRYTIEKYTGSLRFVTQQRGGTSADGNTTSTLRIFKNGNLITTFTQTGPTFVTRTADIAIAPSDVIEWRHRTSDLAGPVQIIGTVALGTNAYTTRDLFIDQLNAGTP